MPTLSEAGASPLAQEVVREVGLRLRHERKRQGIRLHDLAQAVGHRHSHLSRLERGLVPNISLLLIVRLAAALQVPLWKLFLPTTPLAPLAIHDSFHAERADLHARQVAARAAYDASRAAMEDALQGYSAVRDAHAEVMGRLHLALRGVVS